MCGSISSLTHSQNFTLKTVIGTFSSLDFHLIIRISLSTEKKKKNKKTNQPAQILTGTSQPLDQFKGVPGGTSGKEPDCQLRRHERRGFNPWVGNIPRRRACQSTPVFSPGESHGQKRLAGYSPQGSKGLGMTEATQQQQQQKR